MAALPAAGSPAADRRRSIAKAISLPDQHPLSQRTLRKTSLKRLSSRFLGFLCFVVVVVDLSLGLWPFQSPHNNVTWLKHGHGVELGEYATLFSPVPLDQAIPCKQTGATIEVWVEPATRRNAGTILSLYRSSDGEDLELRQSLTDLEVVGTFNLPQRPERTRFYVDDAFGSTGLQEHPTFVTLTTGAGGAAVYLDGMLRLAIPRIRIPDDAFLGRVIVGDSPGQPNSFRGQVRALAIYRRELSRPEALRNFENWRNDGRPDGSQSRCIVALYLFAEGSGNTVQDSAGADADLLIPERYQVIDKVALEPFWQEFDLSRSYWSGNFKNIVGFLPVGFMFCAYFSATRGIRSTTWIVLILGFLLSLTIEVLQIFLPGRDSGTTDLITNTLGTYLGLACYRWIYCEIAARLPFLGWFLPPQA